MLSHLYTYPFLQVYGATAVVVPEPLNRLSLEVDFTRFKNFSEFSVENFHVRKEE
jgi:hypothetical protein